jgi:hypothetical protein
MFRLLCWTANGRPLIRSSAGNRHGGRSFGKKDKPQRKNFREAAMSSRKAAASTREIREVLGDADDDIVSAIRSTGATPAEILRARAWIERGDDSGPPMPSGGRLSRLCEILEQDRIPEDDRGRLGPAPGSAPGGVL